jgi:YegS/Rv2252/BmrU family lipid kinase
METGLLELNAPAPQVIVICNASAGTVTSDATSRISESFSRHPDVSVRVLVPENAADISKHVESAIEQGTDIIAAAGGDGTVNAVVQKLVGQDVALGVLPLGTLNHFAKDLGIPLDLDEAVDTICSGNTGSIDIGEVNGRYFLNNASLGFYPKIVGLRDLLSPHIGKWPAMFLAILAILPRLSWFRVILEWDGMTTRRFVPLLFVGNNPYETSWPDVGRRTVLTKGVLWIMLLKKRGAWRKLKVAILSLMGRISDMEDVETIETNEITIRSQRRRLTISLDGETQSEQTPLVFRSHPRALKVIVPKDWEKETQEAGTD